MFQKTQHIREWLISLKNTRPDIEVFYEEYNKFYKDIQFFEKYWNIVIFMGFAMMTFNLPLDFLSVFYKQFYWSIPGGCIKSLLLAWYFYSISSYNYYQEYLISYLYRHRLYDFDTIEQIKIYTEHRPIALNFFGFTINGQLMKKILVIMINLIIPTLYGIFTTEILQLK